MVGHPLCGSGTPVALSVSDWLYMLCVRVGLSSVSEADESGFALGILLCKPLNFCNNEQWALLEK